MSTKSVESAERAVTLMSYQSSSLPSVWSKRCCEAHQVLGIASAAVSLDHFVRPAKRLDRSAETDFTPRLIGIAHFHLDSPDLPKYWSQTAPCCGR